MGTANPITTLTAAQSVSGAYVQLGTDVTASNFLPFGYGALSWQTVIYDTDGIFDTIGKQLFTIPSGWKYARCVVQLHVNPDDVWAAATRYAVGDIVQPTVGSLLRYQVSAIAGTGTSGAAEPVWPTIIGGTVVDNEGANQITWSCIHPSSLKCRPQLNNEGFGRGVNALSLSAIAGTGHPTLNSVTPWIPVVAGDTFKAVPGVGANRKLTIVGSFSYFAIELRN